VTFPTFVTRYERLHVDFVVPQVRPGVTGLVVRRLSRLVRFGQLGGLMTLDFCQSYDVAEPRGPLTTVNGASFAAGDIAPNQIVAAFGENLATGQATAPGIPLPTVLNGTRVTVRDAGGVERNAPLFFVSATQVNYLVPPATASGRASVTVTAANGKVSAGSVRIAAVAPGLFAASSSGSGPAAGYVVSSTRGASSRHDIATFDAGQNRFIAVPIDLAGPDLSVAVLTATGVRGRSSLARVRASVGGVDAEVQYAGEMAGLFGADQVNVVLPKSLVGRGTVGIVLEVDGVASNRVDMAIR